MHYTVLAERARYFKENEKGVATMCKMMEDMRNEAANEAANKAAMAERIEFASKLLHSENLSYEKVAEYSNLSVEEVKKLAQELGV